jgi:cytidylate kinase
MRIVTLDGPAGCGKSTVSRRVARKLGGRMFSSGRIYRTLTWIGLENGVDFTDPQAVARLALDHSLTITAPGADFKVLVDGVDPGDVLDSTRVTGSIHYISGNLQLRQSVLPLQRSLPADQPVVAEGRDMGTIVFPDAPVKIFLTATAHQRAIRRQAELRQRLEEDLPFEEVLAQVEQRDARDSERDVSPMRPAEDATLVDSTDLDIDGVVSAIMERIPEDWIPGTDSSTD